MITNIYIFNDILYTIILNIIHKKETNNPYLPTAKAYKYEKNDINMINISLYNIVMYSDAIITKNLNRSSSLNNLCYNLTVLSNDKLRSSYDIEINESMFDSFDNNNKTIIKKNYFTIKNRSMSSESLLNYNIVDDNIHRSLFNYYLSFYNFVCK